MLNNFGDNAMNDEKLSKTQAELLAAMRAGAECYYMRYMGRFNPAPYYFRNDTMRRCTAQVKALLDKGLVEKVPTSRFGDHIVRAKKDVA